MEGSRQTPDGTGGPPSPGDAGVEGLRADYIAYMADLIEEMRNLADRLGCQTLAAILKVAREEAELQARRR